MRFAGIDGQRFVGTYRLKPEGQTTSAVILGRFGEFVKLFCVGTRDFDVEVHAVSLDFDGIAVFLTAFYSGFDPFISLFMESDCAFCHCRSFITHMVSITIICILIIVFSMV